MIRCVSLIIVHVPYAVGMTSRMQYQRQHSIRAIDPDTLAAYRIHLQSINFDLVAVTLPIFTIRATMLLVGNQAID